MIILEGLGDDSIQPATLITDSASPTPTAGSNSWWSNLFGGSAPAAAPSSAVVTNPGSPGGFNLLSLVGGAFTAGPAAQKSTAALSAQVENSLATSQRNMLIFGVAVAILGAGALAYLLLKKG